MRPLQTLPLLTVGSFVLLLSCGTAPAGLIRGPFNYSIGPYRGQQWSYFESYNYFGVNNVQQTPYWAMGAVWPDYWNSPYLWGSGSRYSSLFGRRPGFYNPINPAYLTPPLAPGYTKESARDVMLPPRMNLEPGLAAVIDIKMPCFGELWVDGIATEQLGTDRLFRTPPLDRGDYVYHLKARWLDCEGKPVEQTQQIRIHSGQRVRVMFPKPIAPPPP